MTLEKFLSTLTDAKKLRLNELGFTPEDFVDAFNEHDACLDIDNPAIYCGTFAKYNEGNLNGQWIDLSTFGGSYDDFITYCKALHADEQDPELMFQDYANFNEQWYDESPSEADFDRIIEYSDLCEDWDKEAVDAYISLYDDLDIDDFRERYRGEWDCRVDFAEELIYDSYADIFRTMPSILAENLDWQGITNDLFLREYDFEDGHVFLQ